MSDEDKARNQGVERLFHFYRNQLISIFGLPRDMLSLDLTPTPTPQPATE